MRRIMILLAVFGTAVSTLSWPRAAEKKEKSLMRKKLDYSQQILAGITTGDFDVISKNAKAMQDVVLTKGFKGSKSKEYRVQLMIFAFANDELMRHAKDKNLDGAALAHTQLTLCCVNCHKYVRGVRLGRLDRFPARPLIGFSELAPVSKRELGALP